MLNQSLYTFSEAIRSAKTPPEDEPYRGASAITSACGTMIRMLVILPFVYRQAASRGNGAMLASDATQ
jgi:hypothetical protein